MKNIQVLYFASLREQCGKESENIQTSCETPLALYEELRSRYDFSLPGGQVKFAVDNAYVDADSFLMDGMELLLLPPVAGG